MKQPLVYYISQGHTPEQHLDHIKKMVDSGADWVQLRLKNVSKKEVLQTAFKAKEYCQSHQVNLIINDDPEVAKAVSADGVHLGKADQDPLLARAIINPGMVIGGTANTWEDCQWLIEKKVDYIGLGPLRYTTTKKNLSPILGIESYQTILKKMQQQPDPIPVVAIGGINLDDISSLRNCGVSGVALSGLLHRQKSSEETIQQIKQTFNTLISYDF